MKIIYNYGEYDIIGDLGGKTWLEIIAIQEETKEREICASEKRSILEELRCIKKEVQSLLTQNLEGPEDERLDIQSFNLETEQSEALKQKSSARCKQAKLYLEALIVAQNTVAEWSKNYFWDRMTTQAKSIWAISGNFDVQNYVLLPIDAAVVEYLKAIEEQRKMEDLMAKYDSFRPWIPLSEK